MPQCQMDAFLAVSHRLPQIGDKLAEIAKQLKISNHLKALELKAKIDPGLVDSVLIGDD